MVDLVVDSDFGYGILLVVDSDFGYGILLVLIGG